MFTNWLIAKKNIKYDNKFFYNKLENINHNILFDQELKDEDYFWNEKNQEGVFVIGYILPLLSFSTEVCPQNILKYYKQTKEKSFLNYKGNFTIIIVQQNDIVLVSDSFGISKFFYNEKIISNNFWIFKTYSELNISLESLYLYSIFNYWIKDYTLFANISKSEGGYYYSISSGINKKQYFNIKTYLRNREIKYDKKSTFKHAPDLWSEVLSQYLNLFQNERISQTLTAGLDSRMILAGFRKLNYIPETFTFGKSDSMDVHYAKKVASELNVPHHHFYPYSEFFDNFSKKAYEVLFEANSLTTIYRAHRFDAYKKLSKISDVVFFGFIGSEIIRGGVYPDGLTYPNFVLNLWRGDRVSIKDILRNNFLQIDNRLSNIVEQKIFDEFEFYKEPDTHIFEIIIPLHFGQDIRLLEKLGIKSVAPYWDIDFLNFQKSTPYFIDNSKKEELSRLGHFKRRKGPVFSCKMIEILDAINARVSLGKGYTPRDFKVSPNYAAIKFLLKKYFGKKIVGASNFSYSKWFYDTLQTITKDYQPHFFNKSDYENKISIIDSTEELGLLPFVKHANISQINKIMGDSNLI